MKDILGITLLCVTVAMGMLHPKPGVSLSGHQDAGPAQLEVFIDLNCKDSKATWSTLKELSSAYGGRLDVVLQQFPLPYHTFAFILTQVDLHDHHEDVSSFI